MAKCSQENVVVIEDGLLTAFRDLGLQRRAGRGGIRADATPWNPPPMILQNPPPMVLQKAEMQEQHLPVIQQEKGMELGAGGTEGCGPSEASWISVRRKGSHQTLVGSRDSKRSEQEWHKAPRHPLLCTRQRGNADVIARGRRPRLALNTLSPNTIAGSQEQHLQQHQQEHVPRPAQGQRRTPPLLDRAERRWRGRQQSHFGATNWSLPPSGGSATSVAGSPPASTSTVHQWPPLGSSQHAHRERKAWLLDTGGGDFQFDEKLQRPGLSVLESTETSRTVSYAQVALRYMDLFQSEHSAAPPGAGEGDSCPEAHGYAQHFPWAYPGAPGFSPQDPPQDVHPPELPWVADPGLLARTMHPSVPFPGPFPLALLPRSVWPEGCCYPTFIDSPEAAPETWHNPKYNTLHLQQEPWNKNGGDAGRRGCSDGATPCCIAARTSQDPGQRTWLGAQSTDLATPRQHQQTRDGGAGDEASYTPTYSFLPDSISPYPSPLSNLSLPIIAGQELPLT